MKIEKLISDFIDGDLSREQDKLLRDMINEDEFAKRKFETSVDVHMALKDDAASISTPDDLERETEDVVMMKILNKNNSREVVESKRRKPVFVYFSAALLVIVFGIIFRIYENGSFNGIFENDNKITYNQYIDELNPNSFMIDVPDEINYDNSSQNQKILSTKDANKDNNDYASSYYAASDFEDENAGNMNIDLMNNNQIFLYDSVNNINNLPNTGKEKQLISLNAYDNEKSKDIETNNNLPTSSSIRNLPFNGLIILNNNFSDYTALPRNLNIKSSKIQISSFVSNSVINNGLKTNNDEAIINYSQSVAYHSSDYLSFGMEFGYMEFNALRNVNSRSGNKINEISVNSSVEIQDPTKGESFIPARLPVVVNNQLFWGSVFVNYDFYNYNNLILEGRFGTGATSDGPLSYARLQAKYEIYDGIFLNLGSEGRVFIYSIDGNNYTASNLSLIYGIQFAF